MALGKQLKRMLNDRKMTVKELSEKSGVSVNTLYGIIARDNKTIKPDILKKIANTLGVHVGQLITTTDFVNSVSYPDGSIITLPQVLKDLICNNEAAIYRINKYMSQNGYENFDINNIICGSITLDCNNKSDRDMFDSIKSFFLSVYDVYTIVYLEFAFNKVPVQKSVLDEIDEGALDGLEFCFEVLDKEKKQKKNITYIYDSLNSAGQHKLIEFAEMLSKIDEYKKNDD